MPVYKDPRTVKTVNLPSVPDSRIEIYSTLLAGQVDEIYAYQGGDIDRGLKAVSLMIKDWNLTDEKSNKLPITPEQLKKFDYKDVEYLMQFVELPGSGVKKN